MIHTIMGAFRIREIRNKVLFTFAMLGLYRLGAYIPAPSVNTHALQSIQQAAGGGVLSLLNTFSGGALARVAIFGLGITPFITASIVLQVLTAVVPSLEKLSKEGEVGQARITQYTRYLTVGLAFAQSIGYVFLFKSLETSAGVTLIENFNVGKVFLIAITLTSGTVLVMWMGELITQRGIGNGISLMIFASILSRIPSGVQSWWNSPDQSFKVMMPFICFAVVAGIVFVQTGQRRIPVQYAKRVIGTRMQQGGQTFIPLTVNMANVIPVIFAATVMSVPPTIGQLIGQNKIHNWGTSLSNFLSPGGWHYVVGECILIILFTYFYTAVVFNPIDQAENLKKYGGFIPGIRPGRPTAEFLDRVLARLTFPGALFLAFIAALPTILISQTGANFAFGGTSIIIVVGVALDTMRQLEAQLMSRNYEGFLR
ncbi:MAG TPA: preprotein translocase subunit SecY [Solirubrobacteraceae bacterium]|nr:preprotein translocase subunit SecY [Solirubrobacteraceae bacterium]